MEENNRSEISAERLLAAEREERYLAQLERPEVFPKDVQWEAIITYKMESLAPLLVKKYVYSSLTEEADRSDYHELALKNVPVYLGAISRDKALEAVYGDIDTASETIVTLIKESRMFDAATLEKLVEESTNLRTLHFVCRALEALQPEYTLDDLPAMGSLLSALRHLPPLGEVAESRSFFGSEVKYVCPKGHSNSSRQEYCTTCGLNIEGLTEDDVEAVERYARRLNLLKKLLSE